MWTLETIEAIDRIVDYLWEPEKRDYDEQDEDGQANHIFNDLYAVNNELRKLR